MVRHIPSQKLNLQSSTHMLSRIVDVSSDLDWHDIVNLAIYLYIRTSANQACQHVGVCMVTSGADFGKPVYTAQKDTRYSIKHPPTH